MVGGRTIIVVATSAVAGCVLYAGSAVTSADQPKELLAALANKVLRQEVGLEASQIDCRLVEGSMVKLWTAFKCAIPTTCAQSLTQIVYSDVLNGAYITADPIAQDFARQCPEMLTAEALAEASAKIDQGG